MNSINESLASEHSNQPNHSNEPVAALFCSGGESDADLWRVFDAPCQKFLRERTRLINSVVTPENFASLLPQLREVEVIFASWGMWQLAPSQLEAMPKLKAVFYAAGSVKHFAAPLLERRLLVTSAWATNALPVAEFTLAQILLATKGYWRNVAEYRRCEDYGAFRGQGNFGATVSILGAGQIGRRLIELLRPFALCVLCFDPYLSVKGAESLGVEKVETLAEAFARGQVVSNHLADVPATVGMIGGVLLASLPHDATFINTGRGATINHDELMAVWRERPDLTALLDVTEPEPLPLSHPLREFPNIHLTNHIAGSIGQEVARMGQCALQEFKAWQNGQSPHYAISLNMLDTMA